MTGLLTTGQPVTPELLRARLDALRHERLPAPATGGTARRHGRLFEVACEDVSLSKLAEAHWDAVSILEEAGQTPRLLPDGSPAVYGVWASEIPGRALTLALAAAGGGYTLSGAKQFCSGLGLLDRALVSTGGEHPQLVDLDLCGNADRLTAELRCWQVPAFAATGTGGLALRESHVGADELVGPPGWYLDRPGFWHGACGPAACWAGAVAGLLPFALRSRRDDPHTVAHLAAIDAAVWSLQALLRESGDEMDAAPADRAAAHRRALRLRHTVEVLSTDVLRRFARAWGPQPLAMDEPVGRRYAEADLFLRQGHGERDLEALGRTLRPQPTTLSGKG